MNSLRFPSFTLTVLVLCLFVNVQGVDWQGYGNMSSSNLTTIWGYINPRIDKVVQDANTALSNSGAFSYQAVYSDFCTNFSNYLNEQWDLAWNVFVIPMTVAGKDCIKYGYSFRDHWMWYNGYVSNGYYITFIIWKDYNCKVWTNIGLQNSGTLDSSAVTSAVAAVNVGNPRTDIWGTTKRFMESLVTKSGYSGDDKAFTIIAVEEIASIAIFGRVCLAGENKYFRPTSPSLLYSSNPSWGAYIILQMR